MSDSSEHPDLRRLSQRLRDQLDRVLSAEQQAAVTTVQRQSTLRDRLLDLEDRRANVEIAWTSGHREAGRIIAVGQDHLLLKGRSKTIVIPMVAVAWVETR